MQKAVRHRDTSLYVAAELGTLGVGILGNFLVRRNQKYSENRGQSPLFTLP